MKKSEILDIKNCLFLIVDIQEKLLPAAFNKDEIIKNAYVLSKSATILDIPVYVTEQYPKGLGMIEISITEILQDKCKIYEKTDFNALKNKNLCNDIKKTKRKQVVLFGIETHICVWQTAIALVEKGYDVTLVSNASGSRSEKEHENALKLMTEKNINIKTTEMILFELLKTSKHHKFKEIQSLIK